MSRTGWLAVLTLIAIAAAMLIHLRWPSAEPMLDCPPDQVVWVDAGTSGHAACPPAEGYALPAAMALTVGQKLDLNAATLEELALVPGVGPKLAQALSKARLERGRFRSWEEVDAVAGVGEGKLAALQAACRIEE